MEKEGEGMRESRGRTRGRDGLGGGGRNRETSGGKRGGGRGRERGRGEEGGRVEGGEV